MKKIKFILLLICLFSVNVIYGQWINLFNGKDLSGWIQKGGNASYKVENGIIVGTTALNTPNSFLCTDKNYKDFILEVEFKVDPKLNSGVQIRSNTASFYNNGQVHGYQVEIDPDPIRARFWSGGIYDEQRRGWLYELGNNDAARKAFKQNDWNKYRIEAIGDTIKTWVNGVPASYIIDNTTPEGFIGLQVHGIGNDSSKKDIQVSWKSVKIITDPKEIKKNSTKSTIESKTYIYNTLTEQEKKEGWILLFDGKTTTGWRGAYMDQFPEKGWVVYDNNLIVLNSDGAESRNGGDIVTLDEYSDFELLVEFKITKGANSGIKYFVTEKEPKSVGSAFGLEFQILDDQNHPDAKLGRDGNRTIGSLYDLITADTSKRPNKIGDWNQARIISKGKHVEHWLNGKKVVEYERGSVEFKKYVAMSKYADPKYSVAGPFGEAEKGRILLQDHGNMVFFRNVKIKKLK